MKHSLRIGVYYVAFAVVAALGNIGTQELVIRCYNGAFNFSISIMTGTAVGLIIKYTLDKRYIFLFKPRSAAHDGSTLILYTLTGVATTAIFWGFEFGFDLLFKTREWRYMGGAIGLALGYLIKYRLDKRVVFGIV